MPIKDPSLYPADWQEIRKAVRERSGDRCEGSPKYPDCRAENGKPHPVTGSIVVLTVGHLNHDPSERDLAVLKHWCQRCHLTYDAPFHVQNAARTRRAKSPQLDMLDPAVPGGVCS